MTCYDNIIQRAKTCNLIGNLCRHSDKFYSSLSVQIPVDPPNKLSSPPASFSSYSPSPSKKNYRNVLSCLIKCCAHKDASISKFACFAVGNAAFHSSTLYPLLVHSLEPLGTALKSQDEKTRANAAGAIGNLVRNGNQLCKHIVESGVIQILLLMVRDDDSISPQRIALFSLGTLASHGICRAEMGLCKPNASELLRGLQVRLKNDHQQQQQCDEALEKYAIRLKAKLKQQAPSAVVSTAGVTNRPLSGENRMMSR